MKQHKIISAIIALVIAAGLWAYTVVYVSPETTVSVNGIPVQFRMEDILLTRGLIITKGKEQSVSLTVSGKRSDLLKLDSGNVKISADLSNITEPGTWDVSYTISYPDTVANGDVVVESRSSDTVRLEVTLAAVKTLKPTVNIIGEPAAGYLLDKKNVLCDVESVTITGPSYEVEPITKMQVDVDVSGMDRAESRTYSYTLLDAEDKEVALSDLSTVDLTRNIDSTGSGDEVVVTLPILQYKTVTLEPAFENTPKGVEVVNAKLQPRTILITGDSNALQSLSSKMKITVDLSAVNAQQTTWEVMAVIGGLDSGLVVYSNDDENFDGITVVATVIVRAVPEPKPDTPTEPVIPANGTAGASTEPTDGEETSE